MSDTTGTPKKRKKNRTDWKPDFLVSLAETGIVQTACLASGVDRRTAYRHKASDDEFGKSWDEAIEVSIEVLELEADRRARIGVAEPIYYQGVQVGTVQKYSDGLLMFRLKALKPEKYREPKADTNIVINDDRAKMDPEMAAKMLEAAEAHSKAKLKLRTE
jgi:hypothetical protein